VALSLLAFIIVYTLVFGAGSYYILRLIQKGPGTKDKGYGSHGVDKPPIFTDLASDHGGENV
jgi:cytochrome d ubiquinol oxidase subunit I